MCSFVEFLRTVLKLCPTKSCATFLDHPIYLVFHFYGLSSTWRHRSSYFIGVALNLIILFYFGKKGKHKLNLVDRRSLYGDGKADSRITNRNRCENIILDLIHTKKRI